MFLWGPVVAHSDFCMSSPTATPKPCEEKRKRKVPKTPRDRRERERERERQRLGIRPRQVLVQVYAAPSELSAHPTGGQGRTHNNEP